MILVFPARRPGALLLLAARRRLRPIPMTTRTPVATMTPLASGFGDDSEMRQPLAVTVAWGVSISTPINLLLVPAVRRLAARGGPGRA